MPTDPAERPRLRVLITRTTAQHRAFTVVDLLAFPYYESRGWEWIGLDPETETAWRRWRDDHPEVG